jgi:excisionase family DNA binding protein
MEIIKRTYSVPEAAKVLGISRSLAYELVRTKQLPVIELGNKRKVIPIMAIERILSEAK